MCDFTSLRVCVHVLAQIRNAIPPHYPVTYPANTKNHEIQVHTNATKEINEMYTLPATLEKRGKNKIFRAHISSIQINLGFGQYELNSDQIDLFTS